MGDGRSARLGRSARQPPFFVFFLIFNRNWIFQFSQFSYFYIFFKKYVKYSKKTNFRKIFKNGVLGRFWADLDCRFEFYVKNYVGWWVQICFLSIFENLVIWQFGYPAFYQAISIKSTFEPITTPLKRVLADTAWKVSASVENFAPVWAGNCKMDCQNTEFYSRV